MDLSLKLKDESRVHHLECYLDVQLLAYSFVFCSSGTSQLNALFSQSRREINRPTAAAERAAAA